MHMRMRWRGPGACNGSCDVVLKENHSGGLGFRLLKVRSFFCIQESYALEDEAVASSIKSKWHLMQPKTPIEPTVSTADDYDAFVCDKGSSTNENKAYLCVKHDL